VFGPCRMHEDGENAHGDVIRKLEEKPLWKPSRRRDDNIKTDLKYVGGPGSVVGIATGYGLDCLGFEFLLGARFSAPVQTGPGAPPASCTMSTGTFPAVKSGRGVTLIPHSLLVP